MAIKGTKTIAEYAIRKWPNEQNFVTECVHLTMDGNVGTLTDQQGGTLKLVYVPDIKSVHVEAGPQ